MQFREQISSRDQNNYRAVMKTLNQRFTVSTGKATVSWMLLVCSLLIASQAIATQSIADAETDQAVESEQGQAAETDTTEREQVKSSNRSSDEASEKSPEEKAEEARLAAEEAVRLARLIAERDQLEQRLQELQSEEGIYSPALGELYSDLGALQIELSDYDAAAQQYNQALQIARINTGLYSEQQIPLLLSLIDSHQRREDWQQVDNLSHLHLLMHQRLYAKQDPVFLAAAQDFGKWKLRLVNENLLELSSRRRLETVSELSDFYDGLLSESRDQDAEMADAEPISIQWQLSFLESKTEADLTLARAIASLPTSYFTPQEPRYIYQTRCRNVLNAQGQMVRQCYEVRVDNPRFYSSQRDAKRYELGRHTREVERNLDRMEALQINAEELSDTDRQSLQVRIDELRAASREISRNSTRSLLDF